MASSHGEGGGGGGGACATAASTTTSKLPSSIARQPSSIARQTSIYSLTLDEFQNALGDPGKHFGSMNMEEFLKNTWTAEESQAMAVAMGTNGDDPPSHGGHLSVQRQGSITLSRTLSRKTVEDVWKDVASTGIEMGSGSEPQSGAAHERQGPFSEMTLEDFLMKAGVVLKDKSSGSQSLTPFGLNFDSTINFSAPGNDEIADRTGQGSAFFSYRGMEDEKPFVKGIPTLSRPVANLASSQTGPESMQHSRTGLDWLTHNQFRNATEHSTKTPNNLPQHAMESKCLMGNGGLMGQAMAGLGMLAESALLGPDLGAGLVGAPGINSGNMVIKTDSPTSPISDGVGPSYGSISTLSPIPYSLDGVGGGRKRGFEGSLEKVVERRQKRMIKNRESAARSRARKQAYTVELEAEVRQLKEENLRLRLLQEEMADMRRKQFIDVLTSLGPHVAPKARTLRRTQTVPW